MKKNLFTFLLLSGSSMAFGQVGINADNPSASLDILSKGNTSATKALEVNSSTAEIVTVLDNGNVGINVTNPATKLHIVSSTAGSGLRLADGSQAAGNVLISDSDGNARWVASPIDWNTNGNTGTTATSAALGTDISTGNYLGTNDGQNLVFATKKNVKAILDANGTLRGGNSTEFAGNYAAFSWGTNNSIDSSSSNVAIGRNNSVTAINGESPSVAIGSRNTVTRGAKVIGNSNSATGAYNLVFGNLNTVSGTTGITLGFTNTNDGGVAVGSSNNVGIGSFTFGTGNKAISGNGSIVLGINGQGAGNENVYANKTHVFFNENNADNTVVGINMRPSAGSVTGNGAAIQMKGVSKPNNDSCTAAEEGAIRYNSNLKRHEGCNGTIWTGMY
ncbi:MULTISPECIES: hypothetical protein [Chryseobacterium]|uniref:Trimeric autotransporter adhesin YadA-like head domain-containing protein n=1 Tax=Chryseobacterium candidae TaxID=1978493 RepID=A0ABY2R6D7_9FLAO|nr:MULTISPECIES: hypothetical protein [Chryseobacterium]PXW12926.1 hypothetical protein C8D70_11018 [Chryseobacterium sp. CBTAP 102]THV58951.1 hypothetical protein EK417_11320 [Chryseobacterium candidae]SIR56460.1 hypothetical protein SAMN05880573_12737 [Chryseobacterium sp. RU33C]